MKFGGCGGHFFHDDVVEFEHASRDLGHHAFDIFGEIFEFCVDDGRIDGIEYFWGRWGEVEHVEEGDEAGVDRVTSTAGWSHCANVLHILKRLQIQIFSTVIDVTTSHQEEE